MKPSRRCQSLCLVAASLALGLSGCSKPADEDASATENLTAAAASPAPSAAPDHTGRKALGAYKAVNQYLKEQDPALRDKFHKAAERFVRDKDKWRTRLQDQERTLQPRIAQARAQLACMEGKSADTLRKMRQELASLESQRTEAEHRLAELDSVTSETWKTFRDQLKLEDDPAAKPSLEER